MRFGPSKACRDEAAAAVRGRRRARAHDPRRRSSSPQSSSAPMTEGREVVEDYRSKGLTLRRHPVVLPARGADRTAHQILRRPAPCPGRTAGHGRRAGPRAAEAGLGQGRDVHDHRGRNRRRQPRDLAVPIREATPAHPLVRHDRRAGVGSSAKAASPISIAEHLIDLSDLLRRSPNATANYACAADAGTRQGQAHVIGFAADHRKALNGRKRRQSSRNPSSKWPRETSVDEFPAVVTPGHRARQAGPLRTKRETGSIVAKRNDSTVRREHCLSRPTQSPSSVRRSSTASLPAGPTSPAPLLGHCWSRIGQDQYPRPPRRPSDRQWRRSSPHPPADLLPPGCRRDGAPGRADRRTGHGPERKRDDRRPDLGRHVPWHRRQAPARLCTRDRPRSRLLDP